MSAAAARRLESWVSHSPEETHAMGAALGRLLQPQDFIGLVGDLGAGKTALVRGIAEGAGVPVADVTSPSFAIVNVYSGRLPVYHVDLYRLGDEDELYSTGYEDLLQGPGALLVEWIDRIASAAPMDRLLVRLEGELPLERAFQVQARGERSLRLLEAWCRALPGSNSSPV